MSRVRGYVPAVGLFALLVVAWQLLVSIRDIKEYLLPSPVSVAQAAFDPSLQWLQHLRVTAGEVLGGFALAAGGGVLLGLLIAWSPWLERALVPFLVFINSLPKVAVAPLFVIWVGYGLMPNMLMAALIAFFPVVINTAVGLSQVEEDLLDLGRSFGAPRWRVFVKIRLPNAVPYIFSSLKVASTMAVVGAIVGEFIAAQAGLGYIITSVQMSLNTKVAFAAVVWISVLGLALYGAIELLSRKLAPWAQGSHSS